jgi:hypothetical protein
MNDKFKQFIQKARAINLTAAEKRSLRERLAQYADFHAVRNQGPIRPESTRHALLSLLYQPVTKRIMNITASVLIAVLLGGGTSLAAEGAVPGDVLYPVKTVVNENMVSAVTVTTEGEAQWRARLAERRLEEAAELVAEGKFDAEIEARLTSDIQKHLTRAHDEVKTLESEGEYEQALEIRSDTEARVNAYGNVIARMAAFNGGGSPIDVAELLDTVLVERDSAAAVTATATAEGGSEVSSNSKIRAAQRALDRARRAALRGSQNAESEISLVVDAQIESAADILLEAEMEAEAGNTARAFELAQYAQRAATEAMILARNKNALEIRIGNRFESDEGVASGTTTATSTDDGSEEEAATTTDREERGGRERDDREERGERSGRGGIDVEVDVEGSVDAEEDAEAGAFGRTRIEIDL